MCILSAAGAVAVRTGLVGFENSADFYTGAVTMRAFSRVFLPIIAIMPLIVCFVGKNFTAFVAGPGHRITSFEWFDDGALPPLLSSMCEQDC